MVDKFINKVYAFDQLVVDYYTIPNFVAVGQVATSEKWFFQEHIHTSYECVYINKGILKYWCDGEAFVANAGDFYFIQPGQSHKELGVVDDLEFTYLRFKYKDPKGKQYMIVPGDYSRANQLIRKVDESFPRLMNNIHEELLQKDLGAKQMAEALILQLIWLIIRRLDIKNQKDEEVFGFKNILTENAIAFIKENKYHKLTVKDIADHCNVSPDYLSHVFKELTDLSLFGYIDRIKMQEAQHMLLHEDKQVKEIAETFGYMDPLYFSKKFKKYFGLSPNKYKNSYTKTS